MILLLGMLNHSYGQSISGFVSDKSTGERLENANVYILKPLYGTSTNSYGFFNIPNKSNADSVTIICSYVGFNPYQKKMQTNHTAFLTIQLLPIDTLDEAIIVAQKITKQSEDVIDIPIRELINIPVAFGEIDINKSLQFLPGVGSGLDGSSGLHVRGGSPDQNMVLLDDASIFNPAHFAGLLSIFNPDAIKSYRIYKGYIPAKYGERVSSILDVKMNEGNLYVHKGSINLGMISSGVMMNGPIINDKFSYLISARIFNYGLLTNHTNLFNYSAIDGYKFNDINAKLNYIVSNKDRLMFSIYRGLDATSIDYGTTGESEYENNTAWGNTLYSGRWNHVFSNKLFSNTSISYNTYKYDQEVARYSNGELDTSNLSELKIPELRIKTDLEYSYRNGKLFFGGGFTNFNYKTKIDGISYNNIFNNQIYSYIENELNLFPWLQLNSGLRISHDKGRDTSYYKIEPRFMLSIGKNSQKLQFIYTNLNQNLQYLTSNGSGSSIEYWVPAGRNVDPIKLTQLAINYSNKIFQNKVDLDMSIYYKEFSNLIWLKENRYFSGFTDLSVAEFENDGLGQSFGAEILLKGRFNKLFGWLGYTYSHSNRQFQEFNNGIGFPYDFDRRHNIDLFFNYKINSKLELNVAWEYGTGFPFTVPNAIIDVLVNYSVFYNEEWWANYLLYEGKNNARMADYHKLDIGVTYQQKVKFGNLSWRLGLNNAYNRLNPYYYNVSHPEVDYNQWNTIPQYQKVIVTNKTLFPIMPYVGVKFDF